MSEMLGNCPGLNVYGTHIPCDKQQEVSLLMKSHKTPHPFVIHYIIFVQVVLGLKQENINLLI